MFLKNFLKKIFFFMKKKIFVENFFLLQKIFFYVKKNFYVAKKIFSTWKKIFQTKKIIFMLQKKSWNINFCCEDGYVLSNDAFFTFRWLQLFFLVTKKQTPSLCQKFFVDDKKISLVICLVKKSKILGDMVSQLD